MCREGAPRVCAPTSPERKRAYRPVEFRRLLPETPRDPRDRNESCWHTFPSPWRCHENKECGSSRCATPHTNATVPRTSIPPTDFFRQFDTMRSTCISVLFAMVSGRPGFIAAPDAMTAVCQSTKPIALLTGLAVISRFSLEAVWVPNLVQVNMAQSRRAAAR